MDEKQKTPRAGSLDEILAEVHARAKQEPAPAQEKAAPQAEPPRPALPQAPPEEKRESAPFAPEKKEKKRRGLFSRKKEEAPAGEEDIYYGLQLRPLDEYRKEYQKVMMIRSPESEKEGTSSVFSYLFSDDDEDVDREISERFARLHRERQQRVEKIVKETGEEHDIFSFYQGPGEKAPEKETDEGRELSSGRQPAKPAAPVPAPAPAAAPAKGPTPKGPTQKITISAPGGIPKPDARVSEPTRRLHKISEVIPSIPKKSAPTGNAGQKQQNSVPETGPQELPAVREPAAPAFVPDDSPRRAPVSEPPARVPLRGKRREPAAYRAAELPVHVLEWENLEDAVRAESKSYPRAPRPAKRVSPVAQKEAAATGNTVAFPRVKEEEPAVPPGIETEPAVVRSAGKKPDKEEPAVLEGKLPLVKLPLVELPALQEQEEIPEEEEPPRKKRRFHLLSAEEPDNDPQEELPDEQDELDDYQNPEDTASVAHDLGTRLHTLTLRLAVSGICAALLLLFGLLGEGSALLPRGLRLLLPTQTYLILNLVFFAICFVFCLTPIWGGLKSLLKMKADSDSGVAVAALAVLVQSAVLVFLPGRIQDGSLHSYAVLAAGALFLNTAGKCSLVRRMQKNFRFVAAPGKKCAVQLFDDHNTSLQLARDCVVGTPAIAYQNQAGFLKHFLRYSYEPDPGEQSAAMAAPIGFISSLILFLVSFVLTKDAAAAFTVFTAACCVCTPFVNMLCVNLPLARVSKIASRCGGMVAGWAAVEHFNGTNAVMLDAKDLFPRGTVILNGIKTFGGQRIDEAIVDATALMCAVGGPLSDLFDQIIQSRREILPKVETPAYEDEKGVLGWVEGRRVMVGNRELMEAYGVEPPSHDYEDKYKLGGKQVAYLALEGELVAMFLISYASDRRRALELRRMENNGISLIVRTSDPNVTPDFLADCFSLDPGGIRVLPDSLGQVYTGLVKEPDERADALLATKGRPTAMMRLLTACIRQRSNISLGVVLQNVAVILGFVLVTFLACWQATAQLSTGSLILYELFWAAAVLLLPRLRKP